MDPLVWKRIGDLFAGARPLSGERRITFLNENCGGDPEILQQVISLLDADGEAGPLDSTPTASISEVPQIVAGRFRIMRYIAEGGMGTVYEAEDLKLGDRVALKMIRSDIVSDPRAVERFKREISLGKTVTHPNVCRIYDLGIDRLASNAEFLFLTMEFLEGETLASRIKHGPLPLSEALPLIEDMAEALSAAHHADVIHRDFKSGNVMLVHKDSRTCAVVTDFGLARHAKDNRSVSHAGMVGTVSYMAPEQIRGDELTPACDIYALGVVIYEMATGRLPFKGESKIEVAFKHLNDPPPSPRELNPQIDVRWEGAILRCLEKLPQDRFQSAAEVKDALESTEPGSLSLRRPAERAISVRLIACSGFLSLAMLILGAIPSVRHRVERWLHMGSVPQAGQLAVLPLAPPANDPQSAAIEYGLADTLATRLTQLTGTRPLQVVPASEIRTKGITTLDQAREEFGVNLALELSLHRAGDMVRINYGLVDAKTHEEIRGDTITAPISDGFAIEDKVAESVVKTLQLQLAPQEKQLLEAHGTQEPAAYDFYLQGRGYLEEYQKPENVESAITVFNHALEKDPQYALAFSGLGQAYWRKYDLTNEGHWAKQAERACQTSVQLDADQADSHICLGLVYQGTGRYEEAIQQYKLALNIESTNDDAIRGLAAAYSHLGKMSDAEKTYKQAISARPNYWLGYNELGGFYMATGRYTDAVSSFSRAIDLAGDSFRGYSNLGGAYIALGRYDDAVAEFRHSLSIRPTDAAYSNLATAYFQLRKYPEAADNYHAALDIDDQDYVVWGNLGDAYYYSGRQSESKPAYEKAISLAAMKLQINPRDTAVLGDIATYYSMVGNQKDALGCLAKAFQQSHDNDPDLLFDAAMVYNQFGETRKAIDWLEKALASGYSPRTVLNAPALENLHSNPRFQSLLKLPNDGTEVKKAE